MLFTAELSKARHCEFVPLFIDLHIILELIKVSCLFACIQCILWVFIWKSKIFYSKWSLEHLLNYFSNVNIHLPPQTTTPGRPLSRALCFPAPVEIGFLQGQLLWSTPGIFFQGSFVLDPISCILCCHVIWCNSLFCWSTSSSNFLRKNTWTLKIRILNVFI